MTDSGHSRSASGADRSGFWSTLRRWLLIDGNRWTIVGGILTLIFGAFLLVYLVGLVPIRRPRPYFYLYGGLITGNLTLITVTISINQLVLSRELGSVSDRQRRLQGAVDYRREIE